MMLSILVGTSLVSICLGESSKEAYQTSSLRFHREDVPYSYEYTSVHVLDTKNTKNTKSKRDSILNYKPQPRPEKYKQIQYAPLVFRSKDREKYDALYTKASTPENFASEIPEDEVKVNKNLEPKLPINKDNKIHIPVVFATGYLNKITKSYNGNIMNENLKPYTPPYNEDYFTDRYAEQPYRNMVKNGHQEIMDNIKLPLATEPNKYLNPHQPFVIHMENYAEKPDKSVQTLPGLENKLIDPIYTLNVKAPTLHLNVARSYKIAIPEYQARRIKEQQNLFSNVDQQFIPDIQMLLAKNTFLYPNKNKKYINKGTSGRV